MRGSKRLPLSLLVLSIIGALSPQFCFGSPLQLQEDEALVISTTTPSSSSAESWEVDQHPAGVTPDSSEDELNPSTFNGKDVQPVKMGRTGLQKSNLKPDIYSFKIHSDITYRYARTYVTSRVVNANPTEAQEVTFRVVLPETAFISKFIMEIDGTPYEAYVKEKEEAKRVYNQAQSQGQSAGLVELNTRNANVFDVNVNIKSQSKVNFNLTYEELLSRRLGRYEQSISITPDQITNVKDFQITVNIEESQNITLLRVPNLRNDVDAPQDAEGNNQDAVIERPAGNKVNITWRPSEKDQSQLAKQGVTGKFVVQYDIKRELDAGEVLVMNGYFVHFFAPENLPSLRKHVVFVLDTSGSMWGRRMEQLKEAMNQILADLTPDDFFNIFTFSSEVVLWSPEDRISQSPNSNWSPPPFHGERVVTSVDNPSRRQPYPATKENVEKAQKFIQSLVASGGTNIHDSIVQALNLTAAIKKARDEQRQTGNSTDDEVTTGQPETTTIALTTPPNILPPNVESLLMFLTDGEPTVGVTNPTTIQTLIQAANKNISVPIFSIAFGTGVDFPFVRKLSLQNNGFARKIYEASDAAIQLKGFYKEIASPLLSNVTFNYTTPESAYSVENVTVTRFPTVFRGTEIAVAGRLIPKPKLTPDSEEEFATTQVQAEVTEIPTNDAQETDTLLTPTSQHYFDVEIDGSGRDGDVVFLKPAVFSCHIPWEGHIVRPFPPRPTPPPTREDVFLERLWAYLTIQQLIEKDLAEQSKDNEVEEDEEYGSMGPPAAGVPMFTKPHLAGPFPGPPSPWSITPTLPGITDATPQLNETTTARSRNKTEVPETPKQKALRLALKYGFVTSLTSLVVVKPNSSDVTNAVAADANPDAADSLAAPQSISMSAIGSHKVAFVAGGGYTANRITAWQNSNYAGIAPQIPGSSFPGAYGPPGSPIQLAAPPGLHLHGMAPHRRKSPSSSLQHRPVMATYIPIPASQEIEDYDDLHAQILTTGRPIHRTTTPPLHITPNCVTSTPTTTLDPDTTDPTTLSPTERNLTLSDLTWYGGQAHIELEKDGKTQEFEVVADRGLFDSYMIPDKNCTVTETGELGQCVHLADCVQSTFLDDFQLYSTSYFCSIEPRAKPGLAMRDAAGVCCVKNTEEAF